MLFSMTGYGEFAEETEAIRAGFRIKTVNNKFLDVNIKLPFDLMYLESKLRELLKSNFFRGRLDVFSEIEIRAEEVTPATPLNRPRLRQLTALCRQMKDAFEIGGQLDVNTLIQAADLTLTQRVGFRLPAAMEELIKRALLGAVEKVHESRRAEGVALKRDMLSRLTLIAEEAIALEARAEERRKELRDHIYARVKILLEETRLDEHRLNQELIYYADRLDITEELTRLKTHLERTRQLLNSEKRPLGKELDFMLQEQMREVTTIGNKAKHPWIAKSVVKMKTEYEKIREQVQNIE